MSETTVRTDFNKSLDVESNITAKVAFYNVRSFNCFTESSNLFFCKVTNSDIWVNACFVEDIVRELSTDTVDM